MGRLSKSVTTGSGEVCKGPWAFVSKSAPEKSGTGSGDSASSHMAANWDTVYGAGYYVAHVVGNKLYARAVLTGNRGTTIRAEFSNEHNERGQTKGVAEDNNGNVFKVSVYN